MYSFLSHAPLILSFRQYIPTQLEFSFRDYREIIALSAKLSQWLPSLKREREREVAQSCLTLCNPMDSSLHQAPPSMGFSRQEYWSGLLFPSQGIFPTQGSNPGLLHCRQTPSEPPGKSQLEGKSNNSCLASRSCKIFPFSS